MNRRDFLATATAVVALPTIPAATSAGIALPTPSLDLAWCCDPGSCFSVVEKPWRVGNLTVAADGRRMVAVGVPQLDIPDAAEFPDDRRENATVADTLRRMISQPIEPLGRSTIEALRRWAGPNDHKARCGACEGRGYTEDRMCVVCDEDGIVKRYTRQGSAGGFAFWLNVLAESLSHAPLVECAVGLTIGIGEVPTPPRVLVIDAGIWRYWQCEAEPAEGELRPIEPWMKRKGSQ